VRIPGHHLVGWERFTRGTRFARGVGGYALRMSDSSDDQRLDELGEKIDDARRQAEDHGTIPDSDPEPTFADPDGDGDPD
jgi:hypothetical protein